MSFIGSGSQNLSKQSKLPDSFCDTHYKLYSSPRTYAFYELQQTLEITNIGYSYVNSDTGSIPGKAAWPNSHN